MPDSYPRSELGPYGVLPEHTHVAIWTITGTDDALVLALGTSEDDARSRADDVLSDVYKEGHGRNGVLAVAKIGD